MAIELCIIKMHFFLSLRDQTYLLRPVYSDTTQSINQSINQSIKDGNF